MGHKSPNRVLARLLVLLVTLAFTWPMAAVAQPRTSPDGVPITPRVARLQLVEPMRVKGLLVRTDHGPEGFLKEVTARSLALEGINVNWVPEVEYTFNHGIDEKSDDDGIVAMSITESKTTRFEFTVPIIVTPGVAVFRKGSFAPRSAAEMRQLRVIVAKNGAGHQWCLENSVEFTAADSLQEALVAVNENRADVCLSTQHLWRAHALLYDLRGLDDKVVDEPPFHRAFAIAVAPKSKWLVTAFNMGFAKLRDSGEYDDLYNKWLGDIVPPKPSSLALSVRNWFIGLCIASAAGILAVAYLTARLRARRVQLGSQAMLQREFAECVPALAYAYFVNDQGERKLLWTNSKLAEWNKLFPFLTPGTNYNEGFQQNIHPDDIAGYEEATRCSRHEKARFHAEFRLLAVDGRYRSLVSLCLPSYVEGGTIWHGLIVDRTELSEAAHLASSAERNYRTVFDRCHDAALIVDPQSERIIDCNQRAADLYGIEKLRLVGSSIGSYVEESGELLRTDGPVEIRQRHHTADGRLIIADVGVSRIEFAGRGVVLILIRDATERVHAEELERIQREYLERSHRLEGLGRTSGGAAHAFNNYLTAIVGNIELARFEAPPGWTGNSALDRAAESASRAASLARQMLLCSGRGSRVHSLVALDRLVEDTWPLLRAAVPAKIDLKPPYLAPTPPVRADAEELRQALLNFILNATDALEPDGGTITVSTGVAKLSAEQLAAALADSASPGPHAFIEVSDNGPGIPHDLLPRIFEPFYTTRGPARGLGLAVTLGIARRFGGGVEIISRHGQSPSGVTARIYLPLIKPASQVEPRPENHDAKPAAAIGNATSK